MNDRVSVGSTYADILFVLCIVAAVLGLLGGGLVFVADGHTFPTLLVSGAGGLFALLTVVRAVVIAAGRKWLTDTDRGFVLSAHGRDHKFDDEDVVELATKVTTRFSNGWPKANVRKGTLRIDSPDFPYPMAFRYEWSLNREDPLIDLFERLLGRLAKLAEKELARDGELAGEGWALTRDGLEYPTADETDLLRFEQMTAAEVVDGQVCVWATGEPRPTFKVELDSPNAPVLLQVLVKRLADRPPDENDDPESLGRVIFERDISYSPVTMLFVMTFAVLLFLGGLAGLYFHITEPPANRPPLVVAILPHVFAALLAAALWFGRQDILRCHARGVCRVKNGKTTEMRYDEVKVFTYSATRNFHNGSYTGTTLVMQFEDIDGRKLNYTSTIRNADQELESLREHVSRVVAAGWRRRLNAGKKVFWTDRVTFEPDGVAIVGKFGLFGKEDDLFVEWADVADTRLEQGKFTLFASDRSKAVYETTVATPNFFPGFYLILFVRFPRDRDD